MSANPSLSAARIVLFEALVLRNFSRAVRPEFEWYTASILARFNAAVALIPATKPELEKLEL